MYSLFLNISVAVLKLKKKNQNLFKNNEELDFLNEIISSVGITEIIREVLMDFKILNHLKACLFHWPSKLPDFHRFLSGL